MDVDGDIALLSACLLLAIDPEAIEERAAILEYDGGMSHDAANREALFLVMVARNGRFTRKLMSQFYDLAGQAVELEQEHGWQRAQTIDWVMEQVKEEQRCVA